LFFGLLACGGGESVVPEPESIPEVEPVQEPEASMPDFPVAPNSDLHLGSLGAAPDDITAYYPKEQPVGSWLALRIWGDRGDPWKLLDIQFAYVTADGANTDIELSKYIGGEAVPYAAQRQAEDHGRWVISAARSTSDDAYRDLENLEVLIGPSATFKSDMAGAVVTIEPVGLQQATVPAGEFETLRMRRSWALKGLKMTEDSWWASSGLVARLYLVQNRDVVTPRLTVRAGQGVEPDVAALGGLLTEQRKQAGLPVMKESN
jgi:hypothetical protein